MVYGAPRDLLLGLWFVDGRGRLIHAGGKVVKNVAGYDMTRLIAGSAGTLGLVTQATLKTLTRPERCAAISADGPLDGCAKLALEVLRSSLGAVFAAAQSTGAENCWRLHVGFEGFGDTVASQLSQARNLFGRAGLATITEQDYDLLEGPFAAIYARMEACPFVIHISTAADFSASAAGALRRHASADDMLADFGCGRITAGAAAVDAGVWSELCRLTAREGGHAILGKAPDEFKQDCDVFGPTRPEWKVMHRIKDILDPKHVFAPGRMPGRV
jgi:FAD/FMN-containing dehydrogenase